MVCFILDALYISIFSSELYAVWQQYNYDEWNVTDLRGVQYDAHSSGASIPIHEVATWDHWTPTAAKHPQQYEQHDKLHATK